MLSLSASPAPSVAATYAATSSTSNAIANSGSKTFAVQSGLAYTVGTRLRFARTAAPTTTWMEGIVTSYSGTALVATMDLKAGSGTITDWSIGLAGQPWPGTVSDYVADPTDLASSLTAIIALRDALIAQGMMAAS